MSDFEKAFAAGDVPAMMLESFRQMSEDEQRETVMLAANARFVLRMTANEDFHTATGDTIRIIREALTRRIPSLGGEPVA